MTFVSARRYGRALHAELALFVVVGMAVKVGNGETHNGEETARFLGFKPHDIPVLLKAGLLKPLGKPLPNGDKYFATVVLTELRQNVSWLSKATLVVSQHWKEKNAGKTNVVVT